MKVFFLIVTDCVLKQLAEHGVESDGTINIISTPLAKNKDYKLLTISYLQVSTAMFFMTFVSNQTKYFVGINLFLEISFGC